MAVGVCALLLTDVAVYFTLAAESPFAFVVLVTSVHVTSYFSRGGYIMRRVVPVYPFVKSLPGYPPLCRVTLACFQASVVCVVDVRRVSDVVL